MKKYKNLLGISVFILSMSLMVGCVPKSFEARVDWAEDKISDHLDLTFEQETALDPVAETIRTAYPEFITFREDFKILLKTELQNENFSAENIQQKTSLLEKKLLLLSDEIVNEFSTFHKTLTPEQRNLILNHQNLRPHKRFSHFRNRNEGDYQPSRISEIDLQSEQVKTLKKLVSGIAEDSVDLIFAHSQFKKALREELAAQSFDAKRVSGQVQENIKLLFSSVNSKLPIFAELHQSMNVNQRQILIEAVDKWYERHQLEK